MITISAYTEPQSQAAVAETQIHEVYEPDDRDRENFAALFADMLKRTGVQDGLLGELSEVQLSELSNVKVVKTSLTSELEGLSANFNLSQLLEKDDFSALDIPNEILTSLLDAEHLIQNETFPETQAGGDIPDELLVVPAGQPKNFNLNSELEEHTVTAEAASFEGIDDTLLSETVNVNTESVSRERVLESSAGAMANKAEADPVLSTQNVRQTNETHASPDDGRRNNRRDRISINVHDQRTDAGQTKGFSAVEAGVTTQIPDIPTQELTLELRLPNNNSSNTSQNFAQTTWEANAGNALENMLARELHQNFNGDIVRHASMALKDGGNAIIKLALRPESLGSVKIHLEMSENKITGIIVVESEEALNAFKREISSLEQAFRDSGFTNADLNLTLTTGQNESGGREKDAAFLETRTAAIRYDESFDRDLVDVFFGQRQNSVNMLA